MSKMKLVNVSLDVAVADCQPAVAKQVHAAAAAAVDASGKIPRAQFGVNVRIVDEAESSLLNERFRAVAKATNVLAFPVGRIVTPDVDLADELGDLAICLPVVREESVEQHKDLRAHMAHMVIHGTLHLLGYDHIDDALAEDMEARERAAMSALGFPDPYEPAG
jgi:probable rRNA maturation factor